jgi:hypothetical protein
MTTLTSAALAEIHGGGCYEVGAALRNAGYATGNFALVEFGVYYAATCQV